MDLLYEFTSRWRPDGAGESPFVHVGSIFYITVTLLVLTGSPVASAEPYNPGFRSFLGGSGKEASTAQHGITLDRDGNVLAAVTTHSADFPTTANAYQKTLTSTTLGSPVSKQARFDK